MNKVLIEAETSSLGYDAKQVASTFVSGLGTEQPEHKTKSMGQVGQPPNYITESEFLVTYPVKWKGNAWVAHRDETPTFNSQKTETTLPSQTVKAKFTDLKDLSLENKLRLESTQISLQDQILAETIVSTTVPEMEPIFDS